MCSRAGSQGVKRAARLLLLLALVVAGATLAYAGAQPQGYLGAGEVARDAAAYEGRAVEVKGTVVEGSLVRNDEPVRFLVGDGERTLEVRWDPAHPLPDHEAGGTIEGKNVVVHGTVMRDESGAPYLLADQMQVGCASKYRPESSASETPS